jgi:hypothetical protein
MNVGPESRGLQATRGDQAATPALHPLDAVSLAESETHFENAEIVDAHETEKPAGGRRQAPPALFPIIVHPAAFPCGTRTQEHLEQVTVAQPSPGKQAAAQSNG